MKYERMIGICLILASLSMSNSGCSHRVLTNRETHVDQYAQPSPAVITHETPVDWLSVPGRRPFSFYAPPGIIEKPVQGVDSLVGMFQINDIELQFDYGMYSSTLEEFSSYPGYSRQDVVVGGSVAELVQTDNGHMGIVFAKVPAGQKLTMYASYASPESRDLVRKIFLSIQFKN